MRAGFARVSSARSAVSGSIGPASTAPGKSPSTAIDVSAAASEVDGNAVATTSMPASNATLGDACPSATARLLTAIGSALAAIVSGAVRSAGRRTRLKWMVAGLVVGILLVVLR